MSAPAWNAFEVATFAGQHDTHLSTGDDYSTITLASIFDGKPQSKPKMAGNAFLASTYNSYDARSHEAQRRQGKFVALVGDIDKGNLALADIQGAAEAFAGDAAWLVYSSAHSRLDDQRWRIVFPLETPSPFDAWFDAQNALFAFMESRGIPMDHAMSRAGQPIYLPNVPDAYKDGTKLRGDDGQPLYYQTAHSGLNAPGLDLTRGIVAGGISAIQQKRAEDDREREALRKVAAAKQANRPKLEGGNIIDQFNASTSVETMLALCDYEQSPRHASDWRSPQQSGDTYATRVIEGKWVSLSATDAASGLGSKCATGCYGDAYDLYVHYKHGGNHADAYRTIGAENRTSRMPVEEPPIEISDPGWENMPEWIDHEPIIYDYHEPAEAVLTRGSSIAPYIAPNEVSEDAIALEFTREHAGTLRFDHNAGKWYQWQFTHWAATDVPVAFHFAREIGRRLSEGKKGTCKASVAGGAERFARSAPEHAVTSLIWDNDPWLLGTPGGTLDLRTGKMHAARRDEHITKITGCQPENKPAELWLKFLDDATNGDKEMQVYLQRIAGYCLSGMTTEHALFFIYGSGGNGKSVFLNILVHILGDYAMSAPMDTFTASKFSSHPTELAMLKGARLVTASETEENKSWAEARIKALTGGDPITARFMRQDFFTYQPQFKLLFAGNHQPTLSSVDMAMQRRFNMMPFVHKPKSPDHMLELKLKAEAPRILAWALQGCLDWQKDGIARPASVVAATAEYFSEQDIFGQWLDQECNLGVNEWEEPTHLFNAWAKFARNGGEDAGTIVTFATKLKKRGFTKGKVSQVRAWKGLALRARPLPGE